MILYTGPLFTLYNSILRGFGDCGKVAAGVEFGSKEFWEQLMTNGSRRAATVLRVRSMRSRVRSKSCIVCPKTNRARYSGVGWSGSIDVAEFLPSCGFTDRAFMSTPRTSAR